MSLLIVIRQAPNTPLFNEAVTALMGVSMFGQPISLLLMGKATQILSSKFNDQRAPLDELLAMNLFKAAIMVNSNDVNSTSATPTQNEELRPNTWATAKRIEIDAAADFLSEHKNIVSF